jgi:hypothetical protein
LLQIADSSGLERRWPGRTAKPKSSERHSNGNDPPGKALAAFYYHWDNRSLADLAEKARIAAPTNSIFREKSASFALWTRLLPDGRSSDRSKNLFPKSIAQGPTSSRTTRERQSPQTKTLGPTSQWDFEVKNPEKQSPREFAEDARSVTKSIRSVNSFFLPNPEVFANFSCVRQGIQGKSSFFRATRKF